MCHPGGARRCATLEEPLMCVPRRSPSLMLTWRRPLPWRARGVLHGDSPEEPFVAPPWRGGHRCCAVESPSSRRPGGAHGRAPRVEPFSVPRRRSPLACCARGAHHGSGVEEPFAVPEEAVVAPRRRSPWLRGPGGSHCGASKEEPLITVPARRSPSSRRLGGAHCCAKLEEPFTAAARRSR